MDGSKHVLGKIEQCPFIYCLHVVDIAFKMKKMEQQQQQQQHHKHRQKCNVYY